MSEFAWSTQSEEAAQLLAASRLSIEQVAEKVGVSRSTLWLWRKDPGFTSRVDSNFKAYREEVRRCGIAIVENRVAAQNARWLKLQRIIDEREAEGADRADPGASTGLLLRITKTVYRKDGSREVTESYALDSELLREIRETEKQAAQELGQVKNSLDVTSNGGTIGSIVEIPGNNRDPQLDHDAGPDDPPAADAGAVPVEPG